MVKPPLALDLIVLQLAPDQGPREPVCHYWATWWQPPTPSPVLTPTVLGNMQLHHTLGSVFVLTFPEGTCEEVYPVHMGAAPMGIQLHNVPLKIAVHWGACPSWSLSDNHPTLPPTHCNCSLIPFQNKSGITTDSQVITFGFLGYVLQRTGGLVVFTSL